MFIFNRGLDDERFVFKIDDYWFSPHSIYIDGDVVGFNCDQIGNCILKNVALEEDENSSNIDWNSISWIFGKWFLPIPLTMRMKRVELGEDQIEERPDVITLLMTCYNYKQGKFESDRLMKLVFRANDGLKLTNHSIVTDYFEFLTCDFYDSEVGQFLEGVDWIPMTFEQFVKRFRLKSKILKGESLE